MSLKSGVVSFFLLALAISLQRCSTEPSAENKAKRDAYMNEGAKVVAQAQTLLAGNLKQQLLDTGVIGALQFCSLHAIPLTDSAVDQTGKKVYRRSLKARNLSNKPSPMEKNALKVFEYAQEHGEELKSLLQFNERDSSVFYYSPIIIQAMCLNCHGTQDNGLELATFEEIIKRYPKDKAFNYKVGDIRGMWVVEL